MLVGGITLIAPSLLIPLLVLLRELFSSDSTVVQFLEAIIDGDGYWPGVFLIATAPVVYGGIEHGLFAQIIALYSPKQIEGGAKQDSKLGDTQKQKVGTTSTRELQQAMFALDRLYYKRGWIETACGVITGFFGLVSWLGLFASAAAALDLDPKDMGPDPGLLETLVAVLPLLLACLFGALFYDWSSEYVSCFFDCGNDTIEEAVSHLKGEAEKLKLTKNSREQWGRRAFFHPWKSRDTGVQIDIALTCDPS